jgi:uncharacterized protein (TIGR02996 family)
MTSTELCPDVRTSQNDKYGAFMDAIRAEPGHDLGPLVFADWLDEHGEPLSAEFLRLLVACRRLVGTKDELISQAPLRARMGELRPLMAPGWLRGIADPWPLGEVFVTRDTGSGEPLFYVGCEVGLDDLRQVHLFQVRKKRWRGNGGGWVPVLVPPGSAGNWLRRGNVMRAREDSPGVFRCGGIRLTTWDGRLV